MGQITNALPDIPRIYTALCEWLACVVYIAAVYRRVPLSRTVITSALALPVLIVVQYIDGMLPIGFWILGMLAAAVVMAVAICAATGCGKRECLYVTARAFILGELVASLHWQLATFLDVGMDRSQYSWQSVTLLLGTYALCFTVSWIAERSNFSNTKPVVPTLSATVTTVATALVTFAMSNLSFISTNTPFSGSMGQEVFYIRTLVDACGFAILYAQQEQLRRIASNSELASINAQLHSQHQEYLQSKENLESLGRLAHDLKHQITALRAEVDPTNQAKGFEQLEAAVQQYSAQQHTGNPVLDVVLTTKTRTCADKGITFTAVADGSLLTGMSSIDIATLFGNALDNAIEATSRLANREQRLIRLALYGQGEMTVIRFENYFQTALDRDSEGNLRTTKRDKQSHGFGVKSIRHIVKQYDGEVTIKTQDNWFTLTILLPTRRESILSL